MKGTYVDYLTFAFAFLLMTFSFAVIPIALSNPPPCNPDHKELCYGRLVTAKIHSFKAIPCSFEKTCYVPELLLLYNNDYTCHAKVEEEFRTEEEVIEAFKNTINKKEKILLLGSETSQLCTLEIYSETTQWTIFVVCLIFSVIFGVIFICFFVLVVIDLIRNKEVVYVFEDEEYAMKDNYMDYSNQLLEEL
jgi:hypothetical protein